MNRYVDFSKIPLNIKRIKLDVGLSYNAPHTQNWFENDNINNDLYIFGFEPNPECINSILNKNIINKHPTVNPLDNKYINDDYFQLIPVALENVEEEKSMDFYCMTNDCGTSSLKKPIGLGEIKEIVKVPVFSLKHFFDLFDWNRFPIIEYLKIDAQGSDLDIIKSGGDYIKKIIFITAEPENYYYENCRHNNIIEMKNYLETKNFILINHPNTKDPKFINKEYIDLYDKIYIKQIY